MVKHPYLEITYRKGKPFAGYLYLSDRRPAEPCRTEEVSPGVLVDTASDGEVLGIEFLSPGSVTPEDLRAITRRLHGVQVPTEDLSPVMAH
ncbi:MAG TPA: DUF2283 domain-containing protein [Planctomycetota bacterium]|nr:DUF2283 domain-containing protein [Planctomycetota bacterium]HRR81085.1 DUF2283 domain-containing protein [Planctomycetota bacterium]HRT94347.1 DUF2283 domain-containing protein [Planctomycetota bacterium]